MILRDIYKNAFINTKGVVYELPHFSIIEEGFVLTKILVLVGLYNIRIGSLTFTPVNKEMERIIDVNIWETSFTVERSVAATNRRYFAYRSDIYNCDVVFTNSISHILYQIIPEKDLKKYSRLRNGCTTTKTDAGVSVVWQPY